MTRVAPPAAARRTAAWRGHCARAAIWGVASTAIGVGVATPRDASAQAQVNPTVLDTGIPFDLPVTDRVTVLQRTHPELAPLGIRTGGFLLFPQIEVETGATDNVFGASTGKDADGYGYVGPRIDARSQWSRNALNGHVATGTKRYFSFPIKNENAYDVGVDGKVDIIGDSNVRGALTADRVYINQASGDFPQFAAASVPLDRQVVSARGTYQFNRLQLVGDVNWTRLNFTDIKSLSGSRIDQDFLDRTVTRFIARAEYNVSPVTSFFVQATYQLHNYRLTSATLDRTGDEIRVIGGAAFDLTALIRARAGIGYLQRNYDRAQVSNLSGLALDFQLDYYFTQLTTISFAARRDVRDAVLQNSPGYTSTRFAGEVDHELLRNLILTARADYEKNDFAQVNRRDRLLHAGVSAAYTANRHLIFAPSIDYTDRDSNGVAFGQRFKEFRGAISMTLRQ